ncbi:MAG: bifunctional oligoribonuclease/PAP phosphatase NrnA [Anaerovoracaceae bacterium]
MREDSLKKAAELIRCSETVNIFTHVNMDGDALGSSSALCLALRGMGKKCSVIISEEIPRYIDFLEKGCTSKPENVAEEYDLALMLDCGAYGRIPGREDAFDLGRRKGCLDHHAVSSTTIDFDFSCIDADAAATGELVFELINELGAGLTLDIAECLWTAVSTDTGSFQHSSTSARTHEIAARLHRVEGFDSSRLSALLYQRKSPASLLVESTVFKDLRFFAEGKVAIAYLTLDILDECGCKASDADKIIDVIRSLDGVETAAVIKEGEKGSFRASMRAKSYANVAEVAAKFGGGGHVRASGCPLEGPIEHAICTLGAELSKAVEINAEPDK